MKRFGLFVLLVSVILTGVLFAQSMSRDGVTVSIISRGNEIFLRFQNSNNFPVNVQVAYTRRADGREHPFTRQSAVAANGTAEVSISRGNSNPSGAIRLMTIQEVNVTQTGPAPASANVSGRYFYSDSYQITFLGNQFNIVWAGASSSGTFTVSGNTITLSNGRVFTIVADDAIRDSDGDIWPRR